MSKFIEAFKNKFRNFASAYKDGGCDTCGYTEDRNIDEDDYETLLAEIDEWIASEFGNKAPGEQA